MSSFNCECISLFLQRRTRAKISTLFQDCKILQQQKKIINLDTTVCTKLDSIEKKLGKNCPANKKITFEINLSKLPIKRQKTA